MQGRKKEFRRQGKEWRIRTAPEADFEWRGAAAENSSARSCGTSIAVQWHTA
jgi:hypothetical protein